MNRSILRILSGIGSRRVRLGVVGTVVIVGLAAGLSSASASTTPITWRAPHGVAEVHNTVLVDPPTVPAGWTTTFAWKIGGVYSSFGHHYYGFGWSTLGKSVSVKVLVRAADGQGYAKYYNFATVLPLATVHVDVQLMQEGGPPGAGRQKVAGSIEALTSAGRIVASATTNSSGAVTVTVPPGTYTFVGRGRPTGGYTCSAGVATPENASSPTSVEVDCIVP